MKNDEEEWSELSTVFMRDRDGMSDWRHDCIRAHNEMRAIWEGQSDTQRKDYPNASPWVGASDQQVFTIAPRVQVLVALIMNAMAAGQISVFPLKRGSDEKAASISAFMRWMLDRWIPNAREQLELTFYNLLKNGLCATWVGWEQMTREIMEAVSLDDLSELAEEGMENAEYYVNLVNAIVDPEREQEAAEILEMQFSVKKSIARKAVRDLRVRGLAEIPTVAQEFDRPTIEAMDVSVDVIIPAYTTNERYLNRVHLRQYMTEDTLRASAEAQEWDKELVEAIIKEGMGIKHYDIDRNEDRTAFFSYDQENEDLAEIVRTYRRITDEKTGAMGIYETIWCPNQEGVLSHRLMSGWDEFPVVITPLAKDAKRLFDSKGLAYYLRGNQRQSKVARDAFSDQLSIAMNPPRSHPPGRPPSSWGAGARYAVRRGEEGSYRTDDVPNTMREGVAMEKFLEEEADFITGLAETRNGMEKQQYIVNRALYHVAQVVRVAYRLFTQYYQGEEIYFQVTGSPESFSMTRTREDFDIEFFYDVRNGDPKYIKEMTDFLVQLRQFDSTGRINPDNLIDVLVNMRAPQFSTRLLRPAEEAREDIIRNVASDLAMIWSGQSVPAREQGAQIALEYIASYSEKPSVQARLQSDPGFAEDLANYVGRYEFQLQQQQNAVTGRMGGAPTDLEGMSPNLEEGL